MALTGGLQYIDNLALRFSLHGLEDKFSPKPTFCFSWSEPFDLDSVAGKLRSNPKRSRSFPITKKNPEKQQTTDKLEPKQDTAKSLLTVQSKDNDAATSNNNNVTIITTKPYRETRSTSTCTNLEEESSDEELCDIMFEQENIKMNQDFSAFNKRSELHEALGFENLCEKKNQPVSRKRYLEELDTSPSGQAKRPRPRLDFHKVLLSRTNYSDEDNSTAMKRSSFFAPISGSDSDDNGS